MKTRRALSAALLKPKCTSAEIISFGAALIAHGISLDGDTMQESVDKWRAFQMKLFATVEESIRQNWDQLRS